MKRYEFLPHTADVAVNVYGGSLRELFTSAALAMFSVLVTKKKNRTRVSLKEISIRKEAEELPDLLKAWLDELLFHFSSEGLVLHRIKSLNVAEDAFEGKVLLESLDPEHFETKDEIKAVTYHELKVERIRNRWQAHIIFDV